VVNAAASSGIFYLVDESRIESTHDEMIAADGELHDHVMMIDASLDFIHKMVIAEPHKDSEDLILLRLSVRCFNSGAASLRLIRCGYWQPAFALTRDLLETLFLLDLLSWDRNAAKRWHSLSEKERRAEFHPAKVRKRLDERDGCTEDKRRKAYDRLSGYAAHPTPEGFSLISPDMMTQVDPFPNEKILRAALQELVMRLTNAAAVTSSVATTTTPTTKPLKIDFYTKLAHWSSKYHIGE
jgi:hypothetical protein